MDRVCSGIRMSVHYVHVCMLCLHVGGTDVHCKMIFFLFFLLFFFFNFFKVLFLQKIKTAAGQGETLSPLLFKPKGIP